MSSHHQLRFRPAAVFVLTSVILHGGCTTSERPHLIGHLSPRSGLHQALGKRSEIAVKLAIQQLNSDPAAHVEKRPFAIIHGDTGESVDGVIHQSVRLIAVNQVSALVAGRNSMEFDLLAPHGEVQQVVIVSPSGGGSRMGKSAFPVGLSPRERGRVLAKFLAEEQRITDAALVINEMEPVNVSTAAGFEQEFRHAERTIHSGFDVRSPSEWDAIAKRLFKLKPGAIVLCGSAKDLFSLREQLRQNKDLEKTILLYAGDDEPTLLRADADQSRGIIFASAFWAEDKAESVQQFVNRFRQLTPGQEPDSLAAMSYDAINFLISGARKAKSFKSHELTKALDELGETTSLTGPLWLTKQREPHRTVYVMEMANAKPKHLKSYPPEKK